MKNKGFYIHEMDLFKEEFWCKQNWTSKEIVNRYIENILNPNKVYKYDVKPIFFKIEKGVEYYEISFYSERFGWNWNGYLVDIKKLKKGFFILTIDRIPEEDNVIVSGISGIYTSLIESTSITVDKIHHKE